MAYGVAQAQELATALSTISPPIARIYSSPFYRCLETIQPTADKLGLPISADNGLGYITLGAQVQRTQSLTTMTGNGLAMPGSGIPCQLNPNFSPHCSLCSIRPTYPPATLLTLASLYHSSMIVSPMRCPISFGTLIRFRVMLRLRSRYALTLPR